MTGPVNGQPPAAGPGLVTPPEDLAVTILPVEAPMRRLTGEQYNNAVRDLLGIDTNAGAEFGEDEKGGGFASNYRAPIEERLVDVYQTAAEELAAEAVGSNLAALAPCAPAAGQALGPAEETACLTSFLESFGTRAYRRALTAAEVTSYQQLFAVGKASPGTGQPGDFSTGLSLVISTMLQSPNFLYRVELGHPSATATPATPTGAVPLTAFELVSRLSFLLQNTIPDAELLAAAADAETRGALLTPEELTTQATRLLASANAGDTFASFHEQWVELEGLPNVPKSEDIYPEFTPELREAMHDEVLAFVDHVMRQGDARLETLLTANYSFLRGPLFDLYDVDEPPGASDSTPTRVDLPVGERAGLFTLASVMATHSHPSQSSPVKRGYIVLDKLLCTTPPPPPPGIDTTLGEPEPGVSTRERFEQHRTDPACAACHSLMDPLGIAFENYDGIGRYRDTDGGLPVDASSELSGTDQDGPVANAVDMMTRLAAASEVRRCMARQWFRYAFGRLDSEDPTQPATAADQAIIDQALAAFAQADYKIHNLLVALATTPGFRYRLPIQVQ